MNILIVCRYGLYHPLSNSFVHNQAKAFSQQGHRVRVIIPIPFGKKFGSGHLFPLFAESTEDGVEIRYLRVLSLSNFGKAWFNTPSTIAMIRIRLRALLHDFTPDVIHAHTLGYESEVGVWLKRKTSSPLVVTTHGSDTSIPFEKGENNTLRRFCDRANHIVAVSSSLEKKLHACCIKTPTSVILNGFQAQNVVEEYNKKPLSFIQVGNLIPSKRFDITIRAFSLLKKQYSEATLTIIGAGPERQTLEQLCESLEIADSVRFCGQLQNKDVLAEMSKTQFFVMPSVREGFGIVYLEAMACGCIVIGTENEGISDLIVSKTNGFLVPPDNPESIAEILFWCVNHPEEAHTISCHGQEAASGLTWANNAKQYCNLFRKLVDYEKTDFAKNN